MKTAVDCLKTLAQYNRWVQHTAPELEIGTSWYQNRLSLQNI